jgi:hypothetical protein
VTGNCDQCADNYSIDYSGHCSQVQSCGSGLWSVNGECLQYPLNCSKVDSKGFCTQCIDQSYQLMQGQCVHSPASACTARQYLNSGSQCVDVSPACNQFNPSNGQCISCLIQGTNPNQGICCPLGQVYISSQGCANASLIQQTAVNSACLLLHPSLGYCIKCNVGYLPDFSFAGCAKQ